MFPSISNKQAVIFTSVCQLLELFRASLIDISRHGQERHEKRPGKEELRCRYGNPFLCEKPSKWLRDKARCILLYFAVFRAFCWLGYRADNTCQSFMKYFPVARHQKPAVSTVGRLGTKQAGSCSFFSFFLFLQLMVKKKIPTKIGKWHGISLILKLVFQLLFAILFTFNTYPFFIHWKTRLTESYMEDKTESRQIFPMQLHLSYHTLAYTSISPC